MPLREFKIVIRVVSSGAYHEVMDAIKEKFPTEKCLFDSDGNVVGMVSEIPRLRHGDSRKIDIETD